MKKEWLIYIGLFVLGVAAAGRVRGWPGGSKIPSL